MRDECRDSLAGSVVRLQLLRSMEKYSQVGVPYGPVILRLDGVGFRELTKRKRLNPDNLFLAQVLEESSLIIIREGIPGAPEAFRFVLGFVGGDEVDLLLVDPLPYGGRIEKLDSVVSGYFSSLVSLRLGEAVAFDCRVVVPGGLDGVVDYFLERQRLVAVDTLARLSQWYLGKCPEKPPETPQEALEYLRKNGVRAPAWAVFGSYTTKRGKIEGVELTSRDRLRLLILRELGEVPM